MCDVDYSLPAQQDQKQASSPCAVVSSTWATANKGGGWIHAVLQLEKTAGHDMALDWDLSSQQVVAFSCPVGFADTCRFAAWYSVCAEGDQAAVLEALFIEKVA